MSDINDLTQIGLSLKSKQVLDRLKDERYFAEMRDAYKFAIALVLSRGIEPPEMPPGGQTIFAINTIDHDGSLQSAIRTLMPCDVVPPYRWAERLAECGIQIIGELVETGQFDPVSMLVEEQLLGSRQYA